MISKAEQIQLRAGSKGKKAKRNQRKFIKVYAKRWARKLEKCKTSWFTYKKARKEALKLSVLIKALEKDYKFLFLTLTAPNVTSDNFEEEIKEYKNFKLKELQVIGVLNDKIPGKDRKYVENIRKNFDPFLADGNKVKVQLTENGEKLLKSLTNYRPKLLKKEKDFFIFEASNENAKLYFRQFFKDAVIIEPIELRKELKKELEDLLNEYRK